MAVKIDDTTQNFINGKFVSNGSLRLDVISPLNGARIFPRHVAPLRDANLEALLPLRQSLKQGNPTFGVAFFMYPLKTRKT